MKIVLACGCFDGLHIGHITHLEAAKKLGHQLWVGLTVDDEVNKGRGRPVFPYNERADALRALRCVSQVIPNFDACRTLENTKPSIYVKGWDYADIDIPEREVCDRLGIKLVFLNTRPVYHSSEIFSGELLARRIAESR